jgi:hypothetical protein
MSRSSAEARQSNRAVCNLIPILAALLLAWLSTGMDPAEQSPRTSRSAMGATAVMQPVDPVIHAPRAVFAAEAREQQVRSYHPMFQTSDSAGTLGFWMLASLCALLLGAAVAPLAVQRLRQHFRAADPRS